MAYDSIKIRLLQYKSIHSCSTFFCSNTQQIILEVITNCIKGGLLRPFLRSAREHPSDLDDRSQINSLACRISYTSGVCFSRFRKLHLSLTLNIKQHKRNKDVNYASVFFFFFFGFLSIARNNINNH